MALLTKILLPFGFGSALLVAYFLGTVIYNLFFHPLRRFPGPILFRATRIGFCYKLCTGRIPFEVLALHEKYGDIVRIAPDQLAFANPQAWKDIMGHHGSKTSEMQKYDNYYRPIPGTPTHIINANKEEHAGLRRTLAHGFSERRLREQQPIIGGYINLLIQRLKEKGDNGATPLDLVNWYNCCMFDVIGDLAFGEPFGCLEASECHPWVKSFFSMARAGTIMYGLGWWPWLQKLYTKSMPKKQIEEQIQLYIVSIKKLIKRMGIEEERPDFLQSLLEKKDKLGLQTENLESNSSTLVAAGSETTATALSGLTYHLLKNPKMLERLTIEIREAFKSDEEIDFQSVGNLPYLRACVDEILRVYPPTPSALPRTVPEGGATVCNEFLPEKTVVSIFQYAMHRRDTNFTLPHEFHPERFLDDPQFANDNKDAFQAFHIGPRACLGKNLAYLEMRTIIAKLVWNFDLKLASDSLDWIKGQRVFDVWEKAPLNVYLTPVPREQ